MISNNTDIRTYSKSVLGVSSERKDFHFGKCSDPLNQDFLYN